MNLHNTSLMQQMSVTLKQYCYVTESKSNHFNQLLSENKSAQDITYLLSASCNMVVSRE